MSDRIKVLQLITGLDVGGAETMMCRLMERIDRERFDCQVVSLRPRGALAPRLEAAGVPMSFLDIDSAKDVPGGIAKLAMLVRRERPDVVQTWMYHADFLGSLVGRLCGDQRIVWNIQQSQLCRETSKPVTRFLNRFLAGRSQQWPDRIIACSKVAAELHAAQGYARDKMVWICNGAETDFYMPDAEAAAALRRELGIPDGAQVIGMAGRYNPQKDYGNYFAAAGLLAERMPGVHFVACGAGATLEDEGFRVLAESAGLGERFHALGVRSDMQAVYPAFTIAALSSAYGEGFPLTLGEAMACGVPCAATDVGDSAEIIGGTGAIVAPRDSVALADAWERLLKLPADEFALLKSEARMRVKDLFSLRECVRRYEGVYQELAA
ncbi:MAG: glycosyltransferase [Verrucomicrobiales bacterium]|nr:glycosyltransferase [Verrucomicrobiales bacterium]